MNTRPSKDKFQETKNMILKKVQQDPVTTEFAAWFLQEYSATLLNIELSKFKPDDPHYLLLLIFENDRHLMQSGEIPKKHVTPILNKFIELSGKHHFSNIKTIEELYLAYCDFSYTVEVLAIEESLDEATTFLKEKYPEISSLQTSLGTTIAVIYYLDSQANENKENDTNKTILDEYFAILKKYDDLNRFSKPLSSVFVSQETLDRHYNGKLFYYHAR